MLAPSMLCIRGVFTCSSNTPHMLAIDVSALRALRYHGGYQPAVITAGRGCVSPSGLNSQELAL
jgi:hypothetical protein